MLLVPDYVYNFEFKTSLSSLNGIYRVVGLFSYGELVDNDIDLYTSTYKPHGIDEEIYDTDLDSIRSGKIAKLVSVTNPDEIWFIPEHLFNKVPDGSVQRYLHLGLAIDLGVFDDAEQLEILKDDIEQLILAKLGISESATVYSIDHAWLSVTEYQQLSAARALLIENTNNHYTDKLHLQNEIDRLKTLVAYYENTLITLAS